MYTSMHIYVYLYINVYIVYKPIYYSVVTRRPDSAIIFQPLLPKRTLNHYSC